MNAAKRQSSASDNPHKSSNPECMCGCVCMHVRVRFCFLVSFLSPRESWSQYQAGRFAGSVTDYLLLNRTSQPGDRREEIYCTGESGEETRAKSANEGKDERGKGKKRDKRAGGIM